MSLYSSARIMVALALFGDASLLRADEAEPTFLVRTADGKNTQGRLGELKPDWSVRVGEQRIEGADVVSIRRADRPLPPLPVEAQLLLAGGDFLPIVKDAKQGPLLIGERIHFHCPYLAKGEDASVPLSAVSVIWYSGTTGEHPERLRRRLMQETRKHDMVLLKNGDVLEGVLTALDETTITLEVNRKPVTAAVERTAAVALNSDLTEAPRLKGEYGRIVLDSPSDAADGARLSLASAQCVDGETLTGATLFGAALSVPLTKVAAIDLFQSKAIYLSDLKPCRYENFPYLDDRWEYARDATTASLDLRLAGSTYDRGVGLHSHSRLSYTIPPGSRRFEALVGLDDRAGKHGSVRIRLLADGKPLDLGADGELTAAAGPRMILADMAGVKELTLEVDFGKGGPIHDHVDWVDARFIK